MKTKLAGILLLSCFTLLGRVLNAHAEIHVGESAPMIQSFTTWDGKTSTLEAYKGKLIVLEWFNPGCPFVKKHYSVGNMQSLQKEYTAKGVIWLSVNSSSAGKEGSLDAESAHATMKDWNASPTNVILDSNGALGKAFGAKTTPHMFVIDRDGKVVYTGAIDDNDSARSETIAGAKNYVRLALDELLTNKPVTIAQTNSYGCSVKYGA